MTDDVGAAEVEQHEGEIVPDQAPRRGGHDGVAELRLLARHEPGRGASPLDVFGELGQVGRGGDAGVQAHQRAIADHHAVDVLGRPGAPPPQHRHAPVRLRQHGPERRRPADHGGDRHVAVRARHDEVGDAMLRGGDAGGDGRPDHRRRVVRGLERGGRAAIGKPPQVGQLAVPPHAVHDAPLAAVDADDEHRSVLRRAAAHREPGARAAGDRRQDGQREPALSRPARPARPAVEHRWSAV